MNSNRDFKAALFLTGTLAPCYVRSGPREKSSRLDKLRTDLKECEIIHQPKNDENFTSLINAGPRLNAGFK